MVKTKAVAVVRFFDNGDIEINWNRNPVLGVIAIIGPGEAYGCHFPEAVLEEIGIGKSRPYHQAKILWMLRAEGVSPNITRRHRDFSLTSAQYQLAAQLYSQFCKN